DWRVLHFSHSSSPSVSRCSESSQTSSTDFLLTRKPPDSCSDQPASRIPPYYSGGFLSACCRSRCACVLAQLRASAQRLRHGLSGQTHHPAREGNRRAALERQNLLDRAHSAYPSARLEAAIRTASTFTN